MMLKCWLMCGCAAAALSAQDVPYIDHEKIQREVSKAMEAVKEAQFDIDVRAKHDVDFAVQTVLNQKQIAADVAVNMAYAKEAMAFDKAWAMNFNFQDGKGRANLTPDEEMKMMAIDAIMQNDSERAIPLVDKVLQNQQASIRLRQRALQALARSNSTKAWDIVARVAKDGTNVELQSRALQLLGSREGAQNKQLLSDIYASSTNADIKRQVLRSWASSGSKDLIVNAAKSDSSLEVREAAIRHLGEMRLTAELGALYGSETNAQVKERILRALMQSDDWQKMLDIAKTEKNEDLRRRAIQYASSSRSAGAADALAAMYGSSQDVDTRGAILRGLSQQRNAKQLIALARKETDPELKRLALQQLTRMKGDEVTSYLTELLEK